MFLTVSRYVRFIFNVCPVLALRVISLHLPSCRLVSLCFVSLSFSLHSPCFHFCPFHVPFSSPLFPFHFPLLSCHVDFLALPCISPLLPSISRKKTRFFQRFRKEDVQKPTHSFSRFSAKGGRKPKPAREPAGGIEPGTPVLRPALRLVERHQIGARYSPPPKTYASDVGRGGGG